MLREGPTSRPVLHVSTLESMGGSRWREGGRGRETEGDGPIQRGWTLGLPVPSSYLPQAPAKRLIIQTNWTKIRDDRRHNEKVMGFRAENSERDVGIRESLLTTPWDPHPPPSILLPDASGILGADPSPGLSKTRLVEFFSAEPEWTHIRTFEKTSCCVIALKKHQQLTSLFTRTENQIWFFASYF